MKKCRSNGKECPFLDSSFGEKCRAGFDNKLEYESLNWADYTKPPQIVSYNCTLTLIQWTFDDKPNSETFIPTEE